MTRKEYLLKQKQDGKHLFGVFPALYPKEILWAFNIVPVEIWDPPVEIRGANAHLQSYICSVVRCGLELILQGKADFLDGFLFPHTCDSIQNMASVIYDYIGANKPCYFFYHPKQPYSEPARTYYRDQLKQFATSLERQFGHLDPDRLKDRVRQGQVISRLLHEIYGLRSQGELDMTNQEFYRVVRLGEYLFPDDLIPLWEGCLTRNSGRQKTQQTVVILSGILPNPVELLGLLDELGVRIGHDDLLNGSRRLLPKHLASGPGMEPSDPFEDLSRTYFAMPPCSTRGSSISERKDYLFHLIEASGARGVIFNVVKFCEPEWFDIPNLQEELKKRGVPNLVLDTEINQGLSGQIKTRIEAFVEMIS